MIDTQALIDSILKGAEVGVRESLREIKQDAQRRAPVRKLFKGGGRRGVTAHIGVHNHQITGKPYAFAQRVGRTIEGEFIRGGPNSSAPVSQPKRGTGRGIGGAEFREVSRETSGFRLVHENHPVAGKAILGRAKSDVARGRGLHLLPGGKAGTEYGGTLRDSIKAEGPTRDGYQIVGYVKASAIENGFNYAYAQEFGTAHNAPQPYLRPALRDFFSKIGAGQRTAIKTHLERSSHPVRIVASSIELILGPTGSFGPSANSTLVRFGTRLNQALR